MEVGKKKKREKKTVNNNYKQGQTTPKDQSLGTCISGTNHSLQERERDWEREEEARGCNTVCMWVWGVRVFCVCQLRGGGGIE